MVLKLKSKVVVVDDETFSMSLRSDQATYSSLSSMYAHRDYLA